MRVTQAAVRILELKKPAEFLLLLGKDTRQNQDSLGLEAAHEVLVQIENLVLDEIADNHIVVGYLCDSIHRAKLNLHDILHIIVNDILLGIVDRSQIDVKSQTFGSPHLGREYAQDSRTATEIENLVPRFDILDKLGYTELRRFMLPCAESHFGFNNNFDFAGEMSFIPD